MWKSNHAKQKAEIVKLDRKSKTHISFVYERHTLNSKTQIGRKKKDRKRQTIQTVTVREQEWLY